MQKTKSNGQAGPAIPAPTPPGATPAAPPTPQDPFDQVKALMQKVGDQRYAEGFRRASQIIARSVGLLDGEAKAKLTKAVDQLELPFDAEAGTRRRRERDLHPLSIQCAIASLC